MECSKVHWNHDISILKKVMCSICCLFRPHRVVASNWEQDVGRFIELVNQVHVSKDSSVTRMVNCDAAVQSNDPSSCSSSIKNIALMHSAAATVICWNHCDFAVAEVCSTWLVHRHQTWIGYAIDVFVKHADLVDAGNLGRLLFASGENRRGGSAVVKMPVGNKNQVRISRNSLSFQLRWHFWVIQPGVNIDHIGLPMMGKLKTETCMAIKFCGLT